MRKIFPPILFQDILLFLFFQILPRIRLNLMIGGNIDGFVGPGELDNEARALIFAIRFGPDFAPQTLHNLFGDVISFLSPEQNHRSVEIFLFSSLCKCQFLFESFLEYFPIFRLRKTQ